MTTDTRTTKPKNNAIPHTLAASIEASTQPSIGIDVEYYQSFLDDLDVSAAQKQELIETLWTIVVSFVELGFNAHPLNAIPQTATVDTAQTLRKLIKEYSEEQR